MRLLVNGSGDGPFLKVGRHLSEKICSYEFGSSGKATSAESAAHGKAIDRIHVDSGERGNLTEQIESFPKTLVLIFMALRQRLRLHHPGQCCGNASEKPAVFWR